MIHPFSRKRRLALAALTLLAALAAFRFQIADALVIRGDDLLYQNNTARARAMYGRAMVFDPELSSAVDRFIFVSMLGRTPTSLRSAIAAASAYLSHNPNDSVIRADRALCFLIERRYAQAYGDFIFAAQATREPRYYVFAGWAARRGGDTANARRLWHAALAIDPRFRPAQAALREHWR